MKIISDIDARILRALLEDGRKSYRDIAREYNISERIIYNRVKKMDKNGIIVGSTTQENHPDVGYPVVADIYTKASITNRVKNNVEEYLKEKSLVCFGIRLFLFNPLNRSFSIIIQMTNMNQFNEIKKDIEKLILPETIYTDYWTGRTIEMPENLSFGRYKESIVKETPNTFFYRKPRVDQIDLKILEKLRENGRIPFGEIQKEIGVSIDTIARKYHRLRKHGIIKITTLINADRLGYSGILFTRIKLATHRNIDLALRSLIKIPDIWAIVELSGYYDLRAFVLIRDIDHLLQMQQKISDIPSFKEAETILVRELTNSFPGPRHWITNWR
jgi:Lrp/AsnC family transcriptional regulator, regulator for asnA, asnC and gidA